MSQNPQNTELSQALSSAQERLWILEQLAPGQPQHHISDACRLCGPLDQSILQRSISELIRRQPALCTTFTSRGGKPAALARSAPVTVHLRVLDLSKTP